MSGLGYLVIAKRPSVAVGLYHYETAGGIWPDVEPVENHRAWCEDAAAARGDTDVEYIVAVVVPAPETKEAS